MITIKDIAEKAKVSTGTVDRVIHDRAGVSEKTRERIKKILEESNFQVNKIARSLALNKTYKIAALIPKSKDDNSFWSQPKRGIDLASGEILNFRTHVEYFFFDQFDSNSYIHEFQELVKGQPDAVLMAPVFFKETNNHIHLLDEKTIPYLFINIDIKGLNNISFIGQHSYDSGYLAAKLMNLMITDQQQVLIPVVRTNVDNHLSIDNRILGFKTYFKEKNRNVKINEIIITNIEDQNNINKTITKQLVQNSFIKGVFVPSSFVNQIAKYLNDFDLSEIKLIGYDINDENISFLKNETIDFLISQNAFAQGYNGIKALFDYIVNDIKPRERYYSPIKLLTKENIDYIK